MRANQFCLRERKRFKSRNGLRMSIFFNNENQFENLLRFLYLLGEELEEKHLKHLDYVRGVIKETLR